MASIQLGIRAANREELGLSALLDQAAPVQDQDLVGSRIVDSQWAVTSEVQPATRGLRALDELLGDGVEVEVASSRMRMQGSFLVTHRRHQPEPSPDR